MLSYPLHTHTLALHCRFFCTKIDQSAKNHSSLPETSLHRMYLCEEKMFIHYHTFESNLLKNWGGGGGGGGGGRWPSGSASRLRS